MYRAQMLAEYALYDGDPGLFNTESERYLAVTAEEIRRSVAEYLDTDNHSLIEVEPAPEDRGAAPAASASATDEPGAPPPQIPPRPPAQEPPATTTRPETPLTRPDEPHPEKPTQPADAPQQTK
jgi:hypothetical protein